MRNHVQEHLLQAVAYTREVQDGNVQPAEQRKQPPLRLRLAVKLQKHARAAALCGGLHGRAAHAFQLPKPAQDGRFRSIHGQQHRYVLRCAELGESGVQLDLAVVQNHHVVAQLLDLSLIHIFTTAEAAVCAAVAAAAGLAFVALVKRSYRLKGSTYSYNFRENCDLTITGRVDDYIRTTTTQARKPDPPRSSGGGG